MTPSFVRPQWILALALIAVAPLLDAREAGAAMLTASWVDNSHGLARTRVERRLSTSTVFTTIADVSSGVTFYVDRSVTAGVTYCYRAFAYVSGGTSAPSTQACGTARADALQVTVNKTGDGAGTVRTTPSGIDCGSDCFGLYAVGTPVTLVATPAVGSIFRGWTGGGCAGTASCTIVGNAPIAVTATFGRVVSTTPSLGYALRVVKSGQGTVTSTPTDVRCGSICSNTYSAGTVVRLAAIADPGYRFAGWSGACTGTGGCSITMRAATSVTATFVADTPCGGVSLYCE